MDVYFKKADGSRVSEKYFAKPAAGVGGKRFFDETDWRLFTCAVEAPPETAAMHVLWLCQLDGAAPQANGTLLFDDASVETPAAH